MSKRPREMQKVQIYYHHPCNDGMYAGLCAVLAMRKTADYISVHGTKYINDPWPLPKNIDEERDKSYWTAFYLDIRPDISVFKKMVNAFDKIVIIDNHIIDYEKYFTDDDEIKDLLKDKIILTIKINSLESAASTAFKFFSEPENDWDGFFKVMEEICQKEDFVSDSWNIYQRVQSVKSKQLNFSSINDENDRFNVGISELSKNIIDLNHEDTKLLLDADSNDIIMKGRGIIDKTMQIARYHLFTARYMDVPVSCCSMAKTIVIMKLTSDVNDTLMVDYIWRLLLNYKLFDNHYFEIPNIIMICTIMKEDPAVSIVAYQTSHMYFIQNSLTGNEITSADIPKFYNSSIINAEKEKHSGTSTEFIIRMDKFKKWEEKSKRLHIPEYNI